MSRSESGAGGPERARGARGGPFSSVYVLLVIQLLTGVGLAVAYGVLVGSMGS